MTETEKLSGDVNCWCGVSMQATHAPWCEARDGMPIPPRLGLRLLCGHVTDRVQEPDFTVDEARTYARHLSELVEQLSASAELTLNKLDPSKQYRLPDWREPFEVVTVRWGPFVYALCEAGERGVFAVDAEGGIWNSGFDLFEEPRLAPSRTSWTVADLEGQE
jgi:hypothetical protein